MSPGRMRLLAWRTLVGACATLAWGRDVRAEGIGVREIAHWGGQVNDAIALTDGLLVMGSGPRLLIIDVADPLRPVQVGEVTILQTIQDFTLDGSMLFVSAERGGLAIVDVSDPQHPQIIGRYLYDPAQKFGDVGKQENTMYVERIGRVMLFDVSDPTQPHEAGTISNTLPSRERYFALSMCVDSGRLYIGGEHLGPALVIYDLSDPWNPQLRGWVSTTNHDNYGIDAEGNLAALAAERGGVQFYDISDPAKPVFRGAYTDLVYAYGVALRGGLAYVADGPFTDRDQPGAFLILDVADPASPTLLSRTVLPFGNPVRITLDGDIACVCDWGQGLILYDVSDPANPVPLGHVPSPAEMRGVTKVGDRLYIADSYHGMTILDVADPRNPLFVGEYATGKQTFDVAVDDNLAFIGAGYSGLQIVDVSDPANPTFVGADPEGMTLAVAVQGDFAYVGRNNIFQIIDISDPANPVRRGWGNVGAIEIHDIVLDGDVAYAGTASTGQPRLWVIDISDPDNPQPITSWLMSVEDLMLDRPRDLLLSLANEWATDRDEGLFIYDATDRASPVEVGLIEGGVLDMSGFDVVGTRVDVSLDGYLQVFDISDPSNPTYLTRFEDVYFPRYVVSDGNIVYLTGTWGGLFVLEVFDDCNANGQPDYEDIDNGTSADCNTNAVPDECDIADGTSEDCNANGVPDECDLAGGNSDDCNANGRPDECDIADGTSQDADGDGVPDECQCGPPGDLDCDGDIDIADFAALAACFSGSGVPCSGDCCAADLDGDGDVDIADFATLAANFTGSQ